MCATCGVRQSVMSRATGLHPNTVTAYVSRFLAHGGVLCAVPALVANGLYKFLADLPRPAAGLSFYYGLTHVMTLLAFMSLLRIKTVEAPPREAPEERSRMLQEERVQRKARLAEDIRNLEQDLADAKSRRKEVPKSIDYESHHIGYFPEVRKSEFGSRIREPCMEK